MCGENDAKQWTGLTDIDIISIPANSYITVNITENVAATHIAFSYIKNENRIITYADGINTDDRDINLEVLKIPYSYGNISLLGKDGNEWLIKVINNSNEKIYVEYNTKMCSENDAKNWQNLNDVSPFYLEEGGDKNIRIQENFFATNIAVRFTDETKKIVYYANSLNANCTMTVNSQITYIYKYLSISNAGKSGNTWKINITNPLNFGITVYYNKKMCSENDAKQWTGLKDIQVFSLGAGQTIQVTIQENFFATSIAVSYYSNGRRLITYANGLTKSGGINVMTNYILY